MYSRPMAVGKVMALARWPRMEEACPTPVSSTAICGENEEKRAVMQEGTFVRSSIFRHLFSEVSRIRRPIRPISYQSATSPPRRP